MKREYKHLLGQNFVVLQQAESLSEDGWRIVNHVPTLPVGQISILLEKEHTNVDT